MRRMATSFSARAQSAVVRGVARLLHRVLRVLVGRPLVLDGQRLHVASQLGLKLLALAGEKELASSTVAEARTRVAHDAATFEGPKIDLVSVSQTTVQGADRPLDARLYAPPGGAEPAPLLVYFHGGGFV